MRTKIPGRQKVDAAAMRVIGQKGFAEATTQEIARAAGVSEGLIFRYYKTKHEMGLELFRKHHHEILTRLQEIGATQTDPLERVRYVGKEFYRWFDENRDVAQFLIRTHHDFLEKVTESQGFTLMTNAALKDVLGEMLFLLFPSDILSAMLVGALLQVCVECMHGHIQGPIAPRMEPIIDVMVGLLAQSRGEQDGASAK